MCDQLDQDWFFFWRMQFFRGSPQRDICCGKKKERNRLGSLPHFEEPGQALPSSAINNKKRRPPGPLVFPNSRGNVQLLPDIYLQAWKPVLIAAKIVKPDGTPRLTFHSLRHFRASMLIADGCNPKEVMAEMGHSNISMTYDLYGHLFTDDDAHTRRAERAERLALS